MHIFMKCTQNPNISHLVQSDHLFRALSFALKHKFFKLCPRDSPNHLIKEVQIVVS
jgi:hypothetical protein